MHVHITLSNGRIILLVALNLYSFQIRNPARGECEHAIVTALLDTIDLFVVVFDALYN